MPNELQAVDVVASIGKLCVEMGSASRDQKEFMKTNIDCGAEFTKALVGQVNYTNAMSVYGFDFNNVREIKKIGKEHGLEKIVIFPVPEKLGYGPVLFHFYGDSNEMAMSRMNLLSLEGHMSDNVLPLIAHYEKEYGVTVYSRDE